MLVIVMNIEHAKFWVILILLLSPKAPKTDTTAYKNAQVHDKLLDVLSSYMHEILFHRLCR